MTFDESPPGDQPRPAPQERPPSPGGAKARPEREDRPPRNRLERRMTRIREEIERNRRGEAAVPTWVLALILVVLVGGLTALIVLS